MKRSESEEKCGMVEKDLNPIVTNPGCQRSKKNVATKV